MDDVFINTVFQPKPSKQETKADVTTKAARAIIDHEATAREAKTERLRAARLAQEEAAVADAPAAKKPRKKKS
ncbi:hypothetical protein [Neoaquamicrobium sediminum]|uniref:hypothetical protein n=1 Tax=Neoaquamicrobium sediminum TaxID=1849104 RepID=UPI003BAA125C